MSKTSQSPSPKAEIEDSPESKDGSQYAIDTGFRAWLQCLGGFCVFFNTTGLLNSFGLYQTYYVQQGVLSVPASAISWIGTLQPSLLLMGTFYSAFFYDRGYSNLLIWFGSLCIVVGMAMTSLCYEYWQFLLAQGLLVGIGSGCLFLPTTGILALWFLRRRGLAMGFATSGGALGGVVWPLIFDGLVNKVGFRWYTRIVALITLLLFVVPVIWLRPLNLPRQKRVLINWKVFRESEFSLYTVALFIGYMGLFVPYYYIQLYATERVDSSLQKSAYLFAIINGGGFLGRLAVGATADRIGPMNTFIIASGACCIFAYAWIAIHTKAALLAFCAIYGFFSAGIIALPPTIVAVSLSPDIKQYAARMAMWTVPSSIGLLIGNPIAGSVLLNGWVALQAFAGTCLLFCTVLTAAARIIKTGWVVRGRC